MGNLAEEERGVESSTPQLSSKSLGFADLLLTIEASKAPKKEEEEEAPKPPKGIIDKGETPRNLVTLMGESLLKSIQGRKGRPK